MSAGKPDSASFPDPQPPPHVRGRPFQKGNGGRRPGSRNRTTLLAEALLTGDADAFYRKSREVALAGDPQMLKFFLDRQLPKDRLISIELPQIHHAGDAVDALGAIIDAVACGQITPSEAAAVAALVETYARTINIAETEERLTRIEKQLRARG